MSDNSILQEEFDLRESLKGLLEHAGVLDAHEKFYLHRAEPPESSYVLTAHSEVAELMAKYITSLAGIVRGGPVWVMSRAEIRRIILGWQSLEEARKKNTGPG